MKKLAIAAAFTAASLLPLAPVFAAADMMGTVPPGKTIQDFYKQSVYDPSNSKIGSIDDVIVSDNGQVTAFIVGVGGFLGAGTKDVAVPFTAVRAVMKDGAWYLTIDATKDALKNARGYTYDKGKTTWVPEQKS